MKANLMLHCGAHRVDREQLAAVPTPNRTRSWVPVPHARLLDEVAGTLARAGLDVVSEAHGLAKDGLRYFGLLQVAGTDGAAADGTDFGLVVGVRNSHDRTFPAGLVLGSSVFICDNLSFSGQVKLARKHTSRIETDLPALVQRAVGRLGDLRRTQEDRFARYRQTELGEMQAHDLAVRAVDARVLPVTKLPDLLKQWRTPAHPEFAERTAWRFFNGVTEVLKGNLGELPRRTAALHGLLDAACGLVVPEPRQLVEVPAADVVVADAAPAL